MLLRGSYQNNQIINRLLLSVVFASLTIGGLTALLSFSATNLSSLEVNAAPPKIISYQAKVTDGSGTTVANGSYAIKFALYDDASTGNCLYVASGTCAVPTSVTTTITSGVFSILLGDTSAGFNVLTTSSLASTSVYLGVTVGSDNEMTPRKRLVATPYAMNALTLNGMDAQTDGGTSSYILATNASGSLTIAGTGTSTFSNGIQLNGGCYRDASGTCITSGASGANTALSNLSSVAINTTLVSDTNNTDDLGTAGISWKDVYASGTIYVGTSVLSPTNNTADLGGFGNAFNDVIASGTIYGNIGHLANSLAIGKTNLKASGTLYIDSSGNLSTSGSIQIPTVFVVDTSGNLTTSGTLRIQSSGTSTFVGGLTANQLYINGTAGSSTFANGIRLTGGCFLDVSGSCITPSGTGANTALSNLASVAINTSLISDTNNTDDLGTAAISWKDIYASGTIYIGTSILSRANNTADLGSGGSAFNDIFASGTIYGNITRTANNFSMAQNSTNASGTYYIDSSGNTSVSGTITAFSNILPGTKNAVDIGSSFFNFRTVFASNHSAYNGSATTTLEATRFVFASSTSNQLGLFNIDGSGNVNVSGTLSISNALVLGRSGSNTSGTFYVDTSGNISTSGSIQIPNKFLVDTSGNLTTSGTLRIQSTGTSTFTGGINVSSLNITSTTVTSTFANGIQLNGGCFRDASGTCLTAGANTALSNLSSVAINTTLVSDTNNTDDLGTASISWKDVYASGTVYVGASILSRANNTADLGGFGQAFNDVIASGTIYGNIGHFANSLAINKTNLNASGTFYLDSSGNIYTSGTFISQSAGTSTLNGQLYLLAGTTSTFSKLGLAIGTSTPRAKLDAPDIITSALTLSRGTTLSSLTGFNSQLNVTGNLGIRDTTFAQATTMVNPQVNLTNIGTIQSGSITVRGGSAVFAGFSSGGPSGNAAVAMGDINGDGRNDVVTAVPGSDAIQVVINNGAGGSDYFVLAENISYSIGASSTAVAIGDINGDGKNDVVSAQDKVGTVSVLINKATSTFATHVDYPTGSSSTDVAIGDLNGDGKNDLAVANSGAEAVSIFINNGDGTFATHVDYDTAASSTGIAIGDMNGDGRNDVVTANLGAATASVLINNGNGAFAAKVDYATGASSTDVAIGDLNGDGKNDFATANKTADTVSVFLNNGQGTFATKVDYAVTDDPVSIVIGDIHGDGKNDIVTALGVPERISVLRNNGNGTFAAEELVFLSGGGSPVGIAMGDLNGDGKNDVAVVESTFGGLLTSNNANGNLLSIDALSGMVVIGVGSSTGARLTVFDGGIDVGMNTATTTVSSTFFRLGKTQTSASGTLYIDQSGRVFSSGTFAFLPSYAATSTISGSGLVLRDANAGQASSSRGFGLVIPGGFICVSASSSKCIPSGGGAYASGSIYAENYRATSAADVAENFPSLESLGPGDVVTFDILNAEHIKKTTQPNDSLIAGVISTRPGVILGSDGEGMYPLALSGRVPVKVTDENGPINIGDQLVASSHPGMAMKYTSSTPLSAGVIGVALEALSPDQSEGKIIVFIRGTSPSPTMNQATTDLTVSGNDMDSLISYNHDIDLLNHSILNVKAIAGLHWSMNEDGTLKVQRIETDELQTNKLSITSNNDETKTAGRGVIPAGVKSVVVENKSINDKSEIFITWEADPGSAYFVTNKIAGASFTLELAAPVSQDTPFTYWIVDINEATETVVQPIDNSGVDFNNNPPASPPPIVDEDEDGDNDGGETTSTPSGELIEDEDSGNGSTSSTPPSEGEDFDIEDESTPTPEPEIIPPPAETPEENL